MKNLLLIVSAFLLITSSALAQESDEFKPSGKINARVFANYHNTITDGKGVSSFELTRAYLGYSYNFSKNFSGEVLFDAGNPKDGGDFQMSVFVKNAYLKYKSNGFTVKFGVIGLSQFSAAESNWGYRYVAKSFQDSYKFGHSADLGIYADYKFSSLISADFSITNGEGYKKLQGDDVVKGSLGVSFTPSKEWIIRLYADRMEDKEAQTTISTMVGYNGTKIRVGGEYNYQLNHSMKADQDYSGFSTFITYKASSKFSIYARYDNLVSDKIGAATTGWNDAKDGQLVIAGLQYAPVKGVKISPNVQAWSPAADGAKSVTTVFLHCELKF